MLCWRFVKPSDSECRFGIVSRARVRSIRGYPGGWGRGDRGVSVCGTVGMLTESARCVEKSPAGNSKSGTRPERRGVTILNNHGCRNGRFVPLKVDYRWKSPLSSRISHSGDGNSTMDHTVTNHVLFTLPVVSIAFPTPCVLAA